MKINSFEEACTLRNVDPAKLPDVSMLPEMHQKSMTAYYKLIIICEASNMDAAGAEPWQPDWNNHGQVKYNVAMRVDASEAQPAGFGFSDSNCAYWSANTDVGSRLCLKDVETALHIGNTFQDILKDFLLM